jgi:hypothetical protein
MSKLGNIMARVYADAQVMVKSHELTAAIVNACNIEANHIIDRNHMLEKLVVAERDKNSLVKLKASRIVDALQPVADSIIGADGKIKDPSAVLLSYDQAVAIYLIWAAAKKDERHDEPKPGTLSSELNNRKPQSY